MSSVTIHEGTCCNIVTGCVDSMTSIASVTALAPTKQLRTMNHFENCDTISYHSTEENQAISEGSLERSKAVDKKYFERLTVRKDS